MMIPAVDGSLHPITLIDVTESRKTLGVHQCPAGLPDAHLAKMKKNGLDWVDRSATNPLPRRLSRMSHDLQLVPRMKYGIECLLATPSELSEEMRKVMYRVLPHLGVNRNFKTEFCTLPRMFQGLGLVDWPVEKLAADVFIMLQHWNSSGVLGCCLRDAYELLQMETGLEGNIFRLSFRDFGILATHSWMKILWQYLSHLDIDLHLSETSNIPPVRQGDSPIMQTLFAAGWKGARLAAVNRCRKFFQVHRLSCLVACDGKTLRKEFLSNSQVSLSSRTWSLECPTPSDFRLWRMALQALTSSTHRLPRPLGSFLSDPHIDNSWFTNQDKSHLCRDLRDGSFAMYELHLPARFTRSGLVYTFTHYVHSDPSFSHFATVLVPSNSPGVKLHSSSPRPSIRSKDLSFLSVLASWENQTLWTNLSVDSTGQWLTDALCSGSLDIVHDGSFMKKVTPKVCSMALIMRCRITGYQLTCTWTELSNSADNYRAELLGAVCCSLILKAASMVPAVYPHSPLLRHCDNMGVVKHGNRIYSSLKDNQSQADLIRLFTTIDQDLPFPCQYVWVESHTDSKMYRKRNQSRIEKLNTTVDYMAKDALLDGITSRSFISNLFPFETVRVFAGHNKLTGPLRPFISNHSSRRIAKKVFGYTSKRGMKLIDEDDFDFVYWDVFPRVLKDFPSTFCDWLTKHVTGMCGVNSHLSKWDPQVKNRCPCCKRLNENIYHITTCPDPGRVLLFRQMVDELETWLDSHYTPFHLTDCICTYLRGRNTVQMVDLAPRGSPLHSMAVLHDRLGWRSFLEGRISTVLIQEMHIHLANSPARIGVSDWARGFVNFLLRITHRQWTYRNSVVHYQVEGRSVQDHNDIIDEMKRLMSVDPHTLLPKYRHLFEQEDFEALGAGTTVNRLYWIGAVKAAIAASALARQRRRRRRHDTHDLRATQTSTDTPSSVAPLIQPPPVPREPGFRYKKRRLK